MHLYLIIKKNSIFLIYLIFRLKFYASTLLSSILKKCLNDDYYSENGVSKYYQQEYYNIDKFKESYERDHGCKPTDKEIIDHFGYTEARYSAILYEELGPIKTEILQRYTGVDYYKPQSKRRIGQEMGLSKSCVNTLLNEALEYTKEHLRVYYY